MIKSQPLLHRRHGLENQTELDSSPAFVIFCFCDLSFSSFPVNMESNMGRDNEIHTHVIKRVDEITTRWRREGTEGRTPRSFSIQGAVEKTGPKKETEKEGPGCLRGRASDADGGGSVSSGSHGGLV